MYLRAINMIGILACICIQLQAQQPLQPIGAWREHLSYQHAIQVLKGDDIYCATNAAVFSVSEKSGISRYNKVTGLNDIGVSAIGWDDIHSQLVIAYNNSNLDIVKGSIVQNMGDIMRSQIAGNKTIYQITCNGGLAYLSSGLGIIVADLNRYEIKDTWFIGKTGTQVKVNGVCLDKQYLYAATEEGLKRADRASANLAAPSSWQIINNGISGGAVQNVISTNNSIIVQKNDSLYSVINGKCLPWYADKNWPIINVCGSGTSVQVCQRKSDGSSRVLVLDESATVMQTISKSGIISYPKNAIKAGTDYWVADLYGGLSVSNSTIAQIIPNGPPGASSGDMVFTKKGLVVAAGSVNDAWNYLYNRDGIFEFTDNHWSSKSYYNQPKLDSVLDFITVAADPTDESFWAGSFGGGLVHFSGDSIKIFTQKNSSLQSAIGDSNSYRVSGLAFDQNGQLWLSNYGAARDLSVLKKDGSWKSFTIPFAHTENAVSQLLADDAGQIWIISPKGNGIFCYNPGSNIDAVSDDRWKNFVNINGMGNLPSNNVVCMAKDKNGFIWVGTDRGMAVFQCAATATNGAGCDAILPIIQQDRFAGYLFHDQYVQCIAVDGANRKWVGTKNGVWLIAPDGDKILYQFTAENSPLLSNDVKKIAIDPITGEVFMATFNGICSFRSTATEATENNSNVLVFPNPVPPGYQGSIAIRGITNNALVKIAELDGRLVFQTRALGGQAIWDGYQYTGKKAASGVYLVLVRDENGQEKLLTKIVIVSGR